MTVAGITPVLPVPSLDEAVAYWTVVLGVEPTFIDGDRWAQFDIGPRREREWCLFKMRAAPLDRAGLPRPQEGAGLDVFEREADFHPGLIDLDNVVLVPHLGSAAVETRRAMTDLAVRNALTVVAGRPAPSALNPEAAQPRR